MHYLIDNNLMTSIITVQLLLQFKKKITTSKYQDVSSCYFKKYNTVGENIYGWVSKVNHKTGQDDIWVSE